MNNQETNPRWKPTACILCECNCGIEVQLGGDDGRSLLRFRGDKAHPGSKGYACEKPHRLDFYQNGRDRLLWPQRRRPDGSFETIDWETAIREVSQRLSAVRDAHGGESIFYYGGGGQGNHLPGAYAAATRRALGSRYRSNALAQEKTGEFWISHRMLGTGTRGDFEHCEVAFFLGKNPWYSHSIPQARVTLKQIAKDPNRTMIVVDPRRTKTAEMADIHLQVKPGGDAWLMTALLAVLVEEDLLDHAFLDQHAHGLEHLTAHLKQVPIVEYCKLSGVPEAQIREAARVIGKAESVATFEDLGVQMNRNSTLLSYLHRAMWILTGNFGKKGAQFTITPLQPMFNGEHKHDTPVVGAPIIGGLVPCNVIAEEILTDHPKRYRAMIVEAANPVHSLADSNRMREALRALDTVVVIDVAMTETARMADYILPAATQFEKAEATFFNFEFPKNYFHLRAPLMDPPEGPLPEAEIHARLVEEMGMLDPNMIAELKAAAAQGMEAYGMALMGKVAMDPKAAGLLQVILYRTLGPHLPKGLEQGAVLLGLALRCANTHPQSLARAGYTGPAPVAAGKLFHAIISNPSGIIFAVDAWEDVVNRIGTPDGKIHLDLEDMLAEMEKLQTAPTHDADYPFVLSAGERRAYTANTIIRNPHWRKKDASGLLRINPEDAAQLGVHNGDQVRVTTRGGALQVPIEVTDSMQKGHISLPNGMGLDNQPNQGDDPEHGVGAAPNELTRLEDRDPFVGTPWHKYVPARLDVVSG